MCLSPVFSVTLYVSYFFLYLLHLLLLLFWWKHHGGPQLAILLTSLLLLFLFFSFSYIPATDLFTFIFIPKCFSLCFGDIFFFRSAVILWELPSNATLVLDEQKKEYSYCMSTHSHMKTKWSVGINQTPISIALVWNRNVSLVCHSIDALRGFGWFHVSKHIF